VKETPAPSGNSLFSRVTKPFANKLAAATGGPVPQPERQEPVAKPAPEVRADNVRAPAQTSPDHQLGISIPTFLIRQDKQVH
jgi:hypothetical protein